MALDVELLRLLRGWMNSPTFQDMMLLIGDNEMAKSGIVVAALWALWFYRGLPVVFRREVVVAAVVSGMVAAACSRAMVHLLPMWHRPFQMPELGLAVPPQAYFEAKGGSFPSDHMAVAFGITACLWLAWPWIAAAVGAWTMLFVALPRMYLGIHWPSDILGGIVLGIAVAAIITKRHVRHLLAAPLFVWSDKRPDLFYAALFLVMFGLMTRFNDVRRVLHWIATGSLT